MNNLSFPAFAGSRLHLGVTGSISAYKTLDLLRILQPYGVGVSVTLTPAAANFVTPLSFLSLDATRVYGEMFTESESPFDHLEPGTTAHVFAVAPLSATTLARLAHGFADTMLSAQALAHQSPLVLAPAMNPRMWANPATQANVAIMRQRGHTVLEPASGMVACGEEGRGKLPPVEDIGWEILKALAAARNLGPKVEGRPAMQGQKVLVTLGPTWEHWDGVRIWTNRSTGRMGAALATAAWLMGAEVHAVAGPGVPGLPPGVHRYNVVSAEEMFNQAESLWPDMRYGVFTAAVADFSPLPHGSEKFKKDSHSEGFNLHFAPNKDIIATLAARKRPDQRVLGFAAETSDLEDCVRGKLRRKNADLIVGNLVGVEGSGFGSSSNAVFVCTKAGREFALPLMNKGELAWKLLEDLCAHS